MKRKTQVTGRMGELVVELELLKRGWQVANFNSAAANFIGWDLFATKGVRSVKIRVKAKRTGEKMFRWGANAGGVTFPSLNAKDMGDFVAAVSFNGGVKGYEIYIIPSDEVERALRENHEKWLSGKKKDGGQRRDGSMRTIYIDDRMDTVSHGYSHEWAHYLEAWHLLG